MTDLVEELESVFSIPNVPFVESLQKRFESDFVVFDNINDSQSSW